MWNTEPRRSTAVRTRSDKDKKMEDQHTHFESRPSLQKTSPTRAVGHREERMNERIMGEDTVAWAIGLQKAWSALQ